GGDTWKPSAGLPDFAGAAAPAGRVELAFTAKKDQKIVYASVDKDGGTIFRADDGGATFAPTNNTVPYLITQGWYDNAIWAGDPDDPNLVLVGGVELYRSIDGGT